jgi:hypothetical protein
VAALSPQQDIHPPARNTALFVSKNHGFSMEIPAGWHVATGASDDLPLFVNFPWRRLQTLGVLPKGGAIIHIEAEEGLPGGVDAYSLDDWAEFDERTGVPETVKTRSFGMPPSTGVGKAFIVSFDEATFSPSIQQQHDVIVYWEFGDKRFATRLYCVAGDPKSAEYEQQLDVLGRFQGKVDGKRGSSLLE